jgi:hypothetical protein
MNRQFFLNTLIIAGLLACSGLSLQADTNSWRANTRKLDESAKVQNPITLDAASTLAHDLKKFYELLRDKKWHETYEFRAKAFREDVSEANYIAEVKEAEKEWGLVSYDVLSVHFVASPGATNIDEAILICRFKELPDNSESYSTVFWHKEDGGWKCLSAGPHKLSAFDGTRPPVIDWK